MTATRRDTETRRLQVTVEKIEGSCPVYTEGTSFRIEQGYILEGHSFCMHALASIMPFFAALARGIDARDLGLSRDDSQAAWIQCPDPCSHTGGGTVLFRIDIIRAEES